MFGFDVPIYIIWVVFYFAGMAVLAVCLGIIGALNPGTEWNPVLVALVCLFWFIALPLLFVLGLIVTFINIGLFVGKIINRIVS